MKLSGHKIQAISKVGAPTISISTYTNTSITIAWTNRTEPLISYYAIWYSTSQNGVYTKANNANNTTSGPYLISGLTQGLTYYIKIAAVDTSGNIGPFSNIVSSSLTSFTIPDITFNQGQAINVSLSQYYNIPPGQSFVSLTLVQGNLDSETSGITINSGAQQLAYNGTGSPSVKSGLVIRLTTNLGTIDSTPFSTTINASVQSLTWTSDPFPMTIAAGSYVDLTQYYSDPSSELSNITSIGVPFDPEIAITSTPTWRVTATSGATLGTTQGHQLLLVKSAEADWQTRIGGAGVVWYHAFESDAEINQFRWAGGYSGGNDPLALSSDAGYLTRSASGGPGDFPYMEILHPVGTAPNVSWWRPFSALNAPGNGRSTNDPAGGKPLRTWAPTNGSSTTQNWAQDFWGPTTYPQTFYLQMRVMTDPRRFQSNPVAVGKKWFLTTTTNSLTSQELVTYSGTRYHRMYYGGSPPLEDGDTLGRPGQQVGGDLSTYPSDYCDIGTNPGRCWQFGLNQWDTILHEITPGTSTSSPTSTVRIYAANAGQTSYTKIWDLQFTHGWDRVNQYGWNAILFNCYQNNVSFVNPFWQRYAQLIFSTAFIPCPQI